MVTILHFLLIIIIAFLLIVGMVAFRIYTRIRQHANRLKQQMNESFGNNQHSNGSYTSKQNKSKNCSSDEEIIFDVHNSREVNKKIIPKDEGEYVDFTEE